MAQRHVNVRGWRNRQTRTFEGRVVLPCEFKSRPSHQERQASSEACRFSVHSAIVAEKERETGGLSDSTGSRLKETGYFSMMISERRDAFESRNDGGFDCKASEREEHDAAGTCIPAADHGQSRFKMGARGFT